MAIEKKAAGAHRKDLYKAIEFLAGREITEQEHAMFRQMFINYVNDSVVVREIKNVYTCRQCRTEKEVSKSEDKTFHQEGHPSGAKTVSDEKLITLPN